MNEVGDVREVKPFCAKEERLSSERTYSHLFKLEEVTRVSRTWLLGCKGCSSSGLCYPR